MNVKAEEEERKSQAESIRGIIHQQKEGRCFTILALNNERNFEWVSLRILKMSASHQDTCDSSMLMLCDETERCETIWSAFAKRDVIES